MQVKVKVKRLTSSAILPQYSTLGSACVDLHADIENSLTLGPGCMADIDTGLAVEIPDGYQILAFNRSGLSARHEIKLRNAVAVIDSDFRGSLRVMLKNESGSKFTINPGDRIAQMQLVPVIRIEWEEVSELSETARGSGGFGSTGLQSKPC